MTSKVNADNTLGGVILSGDSSGILDLQAGGVTKVTIGPSGVALADVLPVTSGGTGASSLSGITVGTATSATNVAGGVAGNVPYQTGAGATSFVTNGTAGQVLTSAGAAAPTWNTLTVSGSGGTTASGNVTLTSASSGAQSVTPTDYGQYVTLPDATTMTKAACVFNIRNAGSYPVKLVDTAGTILGFIFPLTSVVVGLADNSTSAGVWTADNLEPMALTASTYLSSVSNFEGATTYVALDASRTLLLLGYGTTNLYGIVYDQSSQTWGTATLIRSNASITVAKLIATDQTLVLSLSGGSTALQGVVLSTSGTTITVNTVYSKTVTSNPTFYPLDSNLIAIGSTYVCTYLTGVPSIKALPMTVSGTVITFGAEVSLSGANSYIKAYAVSDSVILFFTLAVNSTVYVAPYTVSGTTLTAGTGVNFTGSTGLNSYRVLPISSGARWVLVWYESSTTSYKASVISVSGSVATASTVVISASVANSTVVSYSDMIVSGSKLIFGFSNSSSNLAFNIVTDTAGTASVGTQVVPFSTGVSFGTNNIAFVAASNNKAVAVINKSNTVRNLVLDYSGSSPTVTLLDTSDSTASYPSPTGYYGNRSTSALAGTTYVYAKTATDPGYRSTVASAGGLGLIYPMQSSPVTNNLLIGAANELWCSVSYTGTGLIQRLECATI